MDNSISQTIQHLLISLVPGSLGVGLGIFISRYSFKQLSPKPKNINKSASFWIPWRGLIVTLFVFLLPNVYSVIWFGLGTNTALFSIFISSMVFTIALYSYVYSIILKEYSIQRISISIFRTALVISIGFGVTGHFYGAGGAGLFIDRGLQNLEYELMWTGYGIIAILAIMTDLATGLFSWLLLTKFLNNQVDS